MSAKFPRGGGAGPFLARSLIMLYLGSIGINSVISELCYEVTILQRNYWKMTILFHGHFPIIPL